MLSTFTVNNPTDSPVAGEIDLRQAIAMANAATSVSTIDFNNHHAGDDHTVKRPTRAEQHLVCDDDRRPRCIPAQHQRQQC